MGSKTIVFLGLVVAMVLLISSEVAAKDLAETTNTVETSKQTEATEAEPTQFGRPRPPCRCLHGCCRCCSYTGEDVEAGYKTDEATEAEPTQFGRPRPPCRCLHGCCRCCSYTGEDVDAGYEAEPHN